MLVFIIESHVVNIRDRKKQNLIFMQREKQMNACRHIMDNRYSKRLIVWRYEALYNIVIGVSEGRERGSMWNDGGEDGKGTGGSRGRCVSA